LAYDLTIASEGYSFGEPEVRFGSGPVTLLMPCVIGMKKTRELLYTGDTIDAEEAKQLGIVNEVVPENKLEQETLALAVKVALVPPEVMRLTKLPIKRTYEIMCLHEALGANIDQSCILNTAEFPELAEFELITEEEGLKAALKWRENRYA
jgi:enoyl-CoA hydratase